MRSTMLKPVMIAVLGVALAGCSDQKPPEETPVDLALASSVLDEVPSDVPNRTFIDFEGKVHLVGWSVEPADKVAPGQTFKLTLYWKSVSRLGPGWRLFTHLVAPGNQRVDKGIDDVGLLRGSLQPSAWKPGKVYVDVQDIQMPQVYSPEIAVAVGIWRDNARLDVISGPSDRERRAIVTHVKTGFERRPAAAQAARPTVPGQLPLQPAAMPQQPGARPVQPAPGAPQPTPGAPQPAPGTPRPVQPGHEGHGHP